MKARFERATFSVAIALAMSLAFSACTGPEPEKSTIIRGSSVSVEVGQALFSLNDRTSYGDSAANSQILRATSSRFFDYNSKSELVPDETFGTATVLSNDPLKVRYTIAEGVTWSDGVPVDASDLLLAWVANSGILNSKDFDPTEYIDPETGEFAKEFPPDVVYFDGATSEGLQYVSQTPEISKDSRSITLTWDRYYVDWPLTLEVGLAAHVVSSLAFGIKSPESNASTKQQIKAAAKASKQLVSAIETRDTLALSKLANTWNSAFNLQKMPEDPQLLVSNGPYRITGFIPNQAVELTASRSYNGKRKAHFEKVEVKFQPDPLLQIQDLKNKVVDLIAPKLDADSALALKELSGFNLVEGDTGSYEHLDLRFGDSKTGSLKDLRVRSAFLLTIPRLAIRQVAQPSATEDGQLRSSLVFFPDQTGYSAAIESNGSGAFLEPDIDRAKQLLAAAGNPNPIVCILYDPASPRRQQEFKLIKESAEKAGFAITDCSSPEWFGLLNDPQSSDASIFSWQVRNDSFFGLQSIYVTNGRSNFNGYSDPEVDGLLSTMSVTSDSKKQRELRSQLDAKLLADAYGLPLYQSRQAVAFDPKIEGIKMSALAPGILWNVEDWKPAKAKPSKSPTPSQTPSPTPTK